MELRVREGDFIETKGGLIFDVKGLLHPPMRIIAYLRYYPDPDGDRIRDGVRYKKVYNLGERTQFLKENHPEFLFHDDISDMMLQGIPRTMEMKVFRPKNFLKKLLGLEEQGKIGMVSDISQRAFELTKLIQKESGVGFDSLGISGSCLVDLETNQSDIDLIVYGVKAGLKVRESMKSLYGAYPEIIQSYTRENIAGLYEFRGKGANISFEDFVKIEKRKKLQGIFKGIDYYIRCIKEWNEIDDEKVSYKSLGRITLIAQIINADDAIFSPCKYRIGKVRIIKGKDTVKKIREIVSFRGRYCEQALKGEEIEVHGKVEEVNTPREKCLRLIVGSSKEDYFKVLNL